MRSKKGPSWTQWQPPPGERRPVAKLWRSSDVKPLPTRVAANLAKSLPGATPWIDTDQEDWWNTTLCEPTLARKARRVVEPALAPTLGDIAREPYWFWAYCERAGGKFVWRAPAHSSETGIRGPSRLARLP
jgi:hypothetical protein